MNVSKFLMAAAIFLNSSAAVFATLPINDTMPAVEGAVKAQASLAFNPALSVEEQQNLGKEISRDYFIAALGCNNCVFLNDDHPLRPIPYPLGLKDETFEKMKRLLPGTVIDTHGWETAKAIASYFAPASIAADAKMNNVILEGIEQADAIKQKASNILDTKVLDLLRVEKADKNLELARKIAKGYIEWDIDFNRRPLLTQEYYNKNWTGPIEYSWNDIEDMMLQLAAPSVFAKELIRRDGRGIAQKITQQYFPEVYAAYEEALNLMTKLEAVQNTTKQKVTNIWDNEVVGPLN